MRWPPPFRSLEHPGAVFAWGMYDLANQSFQLLINTLLFPLFFASVIVMDDDRGGDIWFRMSAAGLLLIVLLSPITGAIADERGLKREFLLTSGFVCSALTLVLGLLGEGQVALAFVVYVIAALSCGLGENFLGSFLPDISTPRTAGRVSGVGWTMSYVGALLLLGIAALYTLVFERNEPSEMRPILIFAGIWFVGGMIPSLFMLRETDSKPTSSVGLGLTIMKSFGRLAQSVKDSSSHKELTRFFIAFAVYSTGTLTMIFGLGIIGDRLGFELDKLILMAVVLSISAGVSAAIAGRVQDRVGHVRTLSVFLIVWVFVSLAMAGAEFVTAPEIVYWLIAGLVGIALGGIGTGSRAMVGALTPRDRAGEYFGLWGMIYKLSGVVGVLVFGELSKIIGQPGALTVVAGMFATGLVLLWRVDEEAGIRRLESYEDVGASQPDG
jgi:UMF1 family MFS transporter